MFTKIPKICILAFVIAPVLVFGNANGSTESATLPTTTLAEDLGATATATATPTGTATTTTLASSNAPATITNDAGVLRESSRKTATAAATERRSPPLENDEVTTTTQATAKSTIADFTNVPTTTTTTNFESKSRAAIADQGSNGNEGKIRQIKNAKEQTELNVKTTESTAETTTTSVEEMKRNELKTTNEQDAPATQVTVTATLIQRSGKPERQRSQRWSNNDDEVEAVVATTIAPTMPNNGVHVERQLENGLYRIKLAEIVTDEFSGLPQMTTETETLEHEHEPQQQQSHQSQPYQVRENVAHDDDDNDDDDKNNNNNGDTGKLNIIDLYPMKLEDFKPIIRDSNAKLLKERTIFTRLDAEEHRQNLMPNEVDEQDELSAFPARLSVNRRPSTLKRGSGDSVNEFTGKLLAEQDGVITEIEQKFQINEFVASETPTSATTQSTGTVTTTTEEKRLSLQRPQAKLGKFSFSVNHKLHAGGGHDFIDRRVKKSFDFPMHRAASDVMLLPHIDFANTKFNTDTSGNPGSSQASGSTAAAAAGVTGAASNIAAGIHPEFSTTKFYNSKELYNEMLQHNKQKLKTDAPVSSSTSTTASSVQTNGASRFGTVQTSKFKAVQNVKGYPDPSQPLVVTATAIEGTTSAPQKRRITLKPTIAAADDSSTTARQTSTTPSMAQPQPTTSKKFQKELKRAKLLLKVMRPKSSATTTTAVQTADTGTTTTRPTESIVVAAASTTATNTPAVDTIASASAATATPSSLVSAADNVLNAAATSAGVSSTSSSASSSINDEDDNAPNSATSSVAAATMTTTARPPFPTALSQRRATNPTKSTSKPIARPRILSRLQEKINSLECEIQNVPPESHLWRGNETHELMLPIVSPENCNNERDCSPLVISWEGEAEIQSGDILIVEINDALLIPNDKNDSMFSAHTTQVYQVTRSGHEHCDVTEGILLDITPLVVDGRKLVTLYDKDLTEGVNLLIVVSELWGSQCVRLKVTTKTDNCGENSDCSGKGVCFSNTVMEEYECQCCSGFAGPHCEEIDACTPSPCTNNGICVDLSQGHEGNSYQCLCPYGYTGKNCQYESDPCNPADCMNGGSCVGNSTHFRCDCTPGYAGPICQHSLNECESSPCVHGICVDQEDGFRCFCQPGFAGELCNFEYNECESNPCQNGGECIDHIGSYECRCTKGYTGNRCQIKVDFCANKPCPEGHRCIDHGNDFSCECPGGRNGPDCNQMPRTQCNVNPCTHGGTCWSSGDSFYCACRPGYTGTMCEDEFVVETVVSSSEFMVDDTSARNFNDKTFGSSVVLKSPIELHNAYFAAGVLAAAIFIVAIVVTICHCKVNQTYRKFSTRSTSFFPILGFGRRPKAQKLNKHWLSGKGLGSGNPLRSSASSGSSSSRGGHLTAANGNQYTTTGSTALHSSQQQQQQQQGGSSVGQLHERPFQRHLAMNLENDMYYTVDFSENSQHSPLIQ